MSTVLAVGIGFLGVLGTVAVAIAISLLTSEARGSVPVLCAQLLDRTAARLPEELRERREEWESEVFDAKDRPLSQILIALRIWREGRATAREAGSMVGEAEVPAGGVRPFPVLTRFAVWITGPIAAGRQLVPQGLRWPISMVAVGVFMTTLGAVISAALAAGLALVVFAVVLLAGVTTGFVLAMSRR